MRAALPDGCEPPPDGADSYELDMWRDDGSQVASVEECWHHCELNLGSMLVGSAPNCRLEPSTRRLSLALLLTLGPCLRQSTFGRRAGKTRPQRTASAGATKCATCSSAASGRRRPTRRWSPCVPSTRQRATHATCRRRLPSHRDRRRRLPSHRDRRRRPHHSSRGPRGPAWSTGTASARQTTWGPTATPRALTTGTPMNPTSTARFRSPKR